MEALKELIDGLPAEGCESHPLASELAMPDGTPAPEALKMWASYDRVFPWYLCPRRSSQQIADETGRVHARAMREILREICIEDVAEELDLDDEDDEEAQQTRAYLEELVAKYAGEFPGFGVLLEPREHPDRVLWFGPDGEVTVIWYEDDAFDERRGFVPWVLRLFG
jgi:hypothetical protein